VTDVEADADPPAEPRQRSWYQRPWYLWAGVGAAILIVVVVIAAIVRPRPQSSYDDAVRARFLEACTAQGGATVADPCGCLYDKIEQNVPFDRFELLDETLAIQTQTSAPGQPLNLPDDIDAMRLECVAQTAGN
jgi:hypothetical protein